MQLWLPNIDATWTWCDEDNALMYGPGKVSFHK